MRSFTVFSLMQFELLSLCSLGEFLSEFPMKSRTATWWITNDGLSTERLSLSRLYASPIIAILLKPTCWIPVLFII